jgi:hypothetical protein
MEVTILLLPLLLLLYWRYSSVQSSSPPCFHNSKFLRGMALGPKHNPQRGRPGTTQRLALAFDRSDMGGTTRSFTPASIALRVIGTHYLYDKAVLPKT